MKTVKKHILVQAVFLCALFSFVVLGYAKISRSRPSSYAPVVITEDFDSIMARMKAAKAEVMKRQMDLLRERYDLSNRPAKGVTMSRGKPIQEGVRAIIGNRRREIVTRYLLSPGGNRLPGRESRGVP